MKTISNHHLLFCGILVALTPMQQELKYKDDN